MRKFGDVVGGSSVFQGAKSVYGMVEGSYVGFSTLGAAKKAADAALVGKPFIVTIGAGSSDDPCPGRVLNLVELSGETCRLQNESMPDHHRAALEAKWPWAAVARTVYLIDDCPLLIADLGFTDAKAMTTNRTGVVTNATFITSLYTALEEYDVVWSPVPLRRA